MTKQKLKIHDIDVWVNLETDFISITDIAKNGRGRPADIIKSYIKNRSNIEFLGVWEEMHNPDFKVEQMVHFRNEVSANDFTPTIMEWIKQTNAIGIQSKPGRYGGTFAHKDIAVHFAAWLKPTFYLYLVKEFQRLKSVEAEKENERWLKTFEFLLDKAESHSTEANRFVRDMLDMTKQLKSPK
ncbi:MAG: KilA-N domain-containing protein [Bacteroidetes bacterium]|jgi:hypothetical protein|nr:KilA-N domain-containing protein [Bacteroidota bacterium]MDF1866184.1 KilA-N domain-containing protein [Saprospiraceae bacterium]